MRQYVVVETDLNGTILYGVRALGPHTLDEAEQMLQEKGYRLSKRTENEWVRQGVPRQVDGKAYVLELFKFRDAIDPDDFEPQITGA
jgi:hypothetical protein